MLEEVFSRASEWFIRTKKVVDNTPGWGDNRLDEKVTAVNTAEAIMGLVFAGADKSVLTEELKHLEMNLSKSIDNMQSGKKPLYDDFYGAPRQVCWPGIAMLIAGRKNKEILDKIAEFLRKAKNNDGGWGYSIVKKGDGFSERKSNTFSTSLVLWFASLAGDYDDLKNDALKWLMNAFSEKGWGWHFGDDENPAATAYALIALKEADMKENDKIRKALVYLESKETSWDNVQGPEGEVRDWVLYTHFTCAWASIALLKWGRNTSEKLIEAIRYILSLRKINSDDPDFGAFSPSPKEPAKTWATMQALFALRLFIEHLNFENILEIVARKEMMKKEIEREIKMSMIAFLGRNNLIFSKGSYLLFSGAATLLYISFVLFIYLIFNITNYKLFFILVFSVFGSILHLFYIFYKDSNIKILPVIVRVIGTFLILAGGVGAIISFL